MTQEELDRTAVHNVDSLTRRNLVKRLSPDEDFAYRRARAKSPEELQVIKRYGSLLLVDCEEASQLTMSQTNPLSLFNCMA
jgi:hypothetical protein